MKFRLHQKVQNPGQQQSVSILFERTLDGMEARSRACTGEAKEAVAVFVGRVHIMTLTAVPAAARAAPRRVSPLALLPGYSRV